MALLHLIRDTMPARNIGCSEYPVPIVYHRHPWFPFKNRFADQTIRSWNLETYDYPPLACGVKAKPERIELVSRYALGPAGGIDIPINTEPFIARRPFVCGLQWVMRPKIAGLQWLWKNAFIGHKSSDVDPYDGAVPLKADSANIGGVNLVFALRHWTDSDVWDYIESNKIPYDKGRYANRSELPDKWNNPDYVHACTRCIDPRETSKEVMCPQTKEMVKNVGNKVLRLEHTPVYIEKEKAA